MAAQSSVFDGLGEDLAGKPTFDQTVIALDSASYQTFLGMLDDPGPPNEKLRQIMRTPAPWEI